MSKRYRDFDAQFAEMRQEKITIRLYGKEYEFPAVIPAFIPLEMAKYSGAEGVPNGVMLRAARVMFGDAALDEWSSHADFDVSKLTAVMKAAFEMVNGEDEDEPEPVTEDDVSAEKGKRSKK